MSNRLREKLGRFTSNPTKQGEKKPPKKTQKSNQSDASSGTLNSPQKVVKSPVDIQGILKNSGKKKDSLESPKTVWCAKIRNSLESEVTGKSVEEISSTLKNLNIQDKPIEDSSKF
eukprot:Gb_36684 [translate_table: standard]